MGRDSWSFVSMNIFKQIRSFFVKVFCMYSIHFDMMSMICHFLKQKSFFTQTGICFSETKNKIFWFLGALSRLEQALFPCVFFKITRAQTRLNKPMGERWCESESQKNVTEAKSQIFLFFLPISYIFLRVESSTWKSFSILFFLCLSFSFFCVLLLRILLLWLTAGTTGLKSKKTVRQEIVVYFAENFCNFFWFIRIW